MTSHKQHFTAKELAGLPGMPGTEQAVNYQARKNNWDSRPRKGNGGGREFTLASLPQATREHLLDQYIAKHPAKVCPLPIARSLGSASADLPLAIVEPPQLPDLGSLKAWQTRTMDARLVFIRFIEQAKADHGVTGAIRILVQKAQNNDLPPSIQALVSVANQRSGKDTKHRSLSERTLMRWWSDYQTSGGQYSVLAPKDCEKNQLPPWAPAFLAAYRVSQNISPQQALATMKNSAPAGADLPSIHMVRRFLKTYSRLDIQRGRKTGAELRAQRSYTVRDASKFNPGDIVLCDGHSFKAYVAHPMHGRPFHPEVCAVVDAVTRLVWGWSAGLAESTFTVADAIRDAVTVREGKPACIPAILYTDNGAGNTSAANADDITGLFPRLGITFKTGRPGNPQGRGRVERLQASLWIRAAKELPTYTGRGMDALTRRKVYLTLDKDVRAAKKSNSRINSELLISWADFLDYCDQVVADYNRRPHSALPRIRDAVTGTRRNQSPLECLADFISQGWQPVLAEPEELQHLFRPQVQVKARRGTVTVFGNSYHNADLEHYQGDLVNVSYDIHDPSSVIVRDWEQRLICTAKFEGNKRDFYAVPVVEQAREQRRKRRSATLERHLEEVQLEANAPIEIPVKIELPPAVIDFERRLEEKQAQEALAPKYFKNIVEFYDDIREREKRGEASDYEITWANDKDRSGVKRYGLYKDDPQCAGRFGKQQAL